MSRKPFIAGNWKMHNTVGESLALAGAVKAAPNKNNADICLAPSFTSLHAVGELLKNTPILLAAQDCYYQEKGAYTSAVSPSQVKDLAPYVILGHSERRSIFGDSNEILNKKTRAALGKGLKVIFCIGETLEQREANQTAAVTKEQLAQGLKDFTADELAGLVVAYEPVWAIGTGKTATPEQAQEAHLQIRAQLAELFGADYAHDTRILYGGSVKADNIDAIMAGPDVDGALVGGQALEADKFIRIINFNK